MVHLQWARSVDGSWCDLQRVDVSHIDAPGVFVVWHGGRRPRTLKLGYGAIGSRISAHQRDAGLLRYRQSGPLYVTWAMVPPNLLEGVTRFLAGRLMPLFEDRVRMTQAIPANPPA